MALLLAFNFAGNALDLFAHQYSIGHPSRYSRKFQSYLSRATCSCLLDSPSLDVEHLDHIVSSSLGQDVCPSTNVVGKSIIESRGKKAKKHDDPVITVVCNGQLSLVQAVVQLLVGPLYALLGTEMYKTLL
jgi:hypothetical protein